MIKQAAQTFEQQRPKMGLLAWSSHNLPHPFSRYLSLKAWSDWVNPQAAMITLAPTMTQTNKRSDGDDDKQTEQEEESTSENLTPIKGAMTPPDTLPGDLSRWIASTMPHNKSLLESVAAKTTETASMMSDNKSLLESVAAKTTEYQPIAVQENGGYGICTRALSINYGAFAFLMIPPTPPGLECIVEVKHPS
jgi:hypothetical protein